TTFGGSNESSTSGRLSLSQISPGLGRGANWLGVRSSEHAENASPARNDHVTARLRSPRAARDERFRIEGQDTARPSHQRELGPQCAKTKKPAQRGRGGSHSSRGHYGNMRGPCQ